MWNTSRHTRQIKILLATFFLCLATNANAVRDGETVYQSECVHCHASGVERMPTLQTLKGMQTEAIIQSLGSGSMRIIGTFELNGPERIAQPAPTADKYPTAHNCGLGLGHGLTGKGKGPLECKVFDLVCL